MTRLAALGALAGCTAASSPDAVRTAWLIDVLLDDNRVWLSRADGPELLEAKYRTMAADPYDYMRGSVAVFLADLARPAPGRSPTGFVREEEAASILIVVDPHPENVGTLLPGEGPGPGLDDEREAALVLELNDFDGATFGPYLVDVRRALLGLAAAIAPACDRHCREGVLSAWVEGYLDEIDDIADGEPTFSAAVHPTGQSLVLDRLLVDALEEGRERKRLVEQTEQAGDGLRIRIDDAPDPRTGDGTVLPTAEERAQIDRLLAELPRPPGFRALDAARRLGGGVASMPAVRYLVAWDRGGEGPQDDELLELREVIDPPAVPGLRQVVPPGFDSNASRMVQAPRTLWSRPDADARNAAVSDGIMTFKASTESSWNQAFDHRKLAADLAAGRFAPPDLRIWAELLGRQLASAHGRSVTADGQPAIDAIARDLQEREEPFAAERLREAERDLETTLRDHALLGTALDDFGPLLGADR